MIPYKIYQIDLGEMTDKEFMDLKNETKQNTIPNVWIGDTFIGGNDETQTKHKNGELDLLFKKYNIVSTSSKL